MEEHEKSKGFGIRLVLVQMSNLLLASWMPLNKLIMPAESQFWKTKQLKRAILFSLSWRKDDNGVPVNVYEVSERKKSWFIGFADSHGINTPPQALQVANIALLDAERGHWAPESQPWARASLPLILEDLMNVKTQDSFPIYQEINKCTWTLSPLGPVLQVPESEADSEASHGREIHKQIPSWSKGNRGDDWREGTSWCWGENQIQRKKISRRKRTPLSNPRTPTVKDWNSYPAQPWYHPEPLHSAIT